jgi:hypothetical protein
VRIGEGIFATVILQTRDLSPAREMGMTGVIGPEEARNARPLVPLLWLDDKP